MPIAHFVVDWMAGLVEERVRFIASLPIFAKCSADFARQLAEDARPLALPQSFVLGRKGEPASAVFLLRRGRVKIMATTRTSAGRREGTRLCGVKRRVGLLLRGLGEGRGKVRGVGLGD